jgi:5'(3')-deoxyribonucleotidase
MRPQLFVDLDGVLADFDTGFELCFGVRPNQDNYEPPGMWDLVRNHGNFYRELPMMKDAHTLMRGLLVWHPQPIILTGIPHSIPRVVEQKIAWVEEHLGNQYPVICCPSVDKHKHGRPADILIDDRLKYSKHWINMGGIFIHYQDLNTTLAAVAMAYHHAR